MQQFDVIVIGAGAAGLMCAAQVGQGGNALQLGCELVDGGSG